MDAGAERVRVGEGDRVTDSIIVAILSLAGTLIGSLTGILTANKLVNYRLKKLEEKVQAHNNLIERTYKLEGRMCEVEHNIRDLRNER